MTNEEKALSIANLKEISETDTYENPFKVAIYERCLNMAEWKDEQHKQELIRIYNFVSPYLTPEANNDLKIIIGLC